MADEQTAIPGHYTVRVCPVHRCQVGRGDQGEALCRHGHEVNSPDAVEVVPVAEVERLREEADIRNRAFTEGETAWRAEVERLRGLLDERARRTRAVPPR